MVYQNATFDFGTTWTDQTINNDFKSALAVAILYCEGKINDDDKAR